MNGTCRKPHRQDRSRRERGFEALIDLTRDRRPRVRMQAARGLAALGKIAATPSLESLKQRLPAQDEADIERLIRRLRKGTEGNSAPALRSSI